MTQTEVGGRASCTELIRVSVLWTLDCCSGQVEIGKLHQRLAASEEERRREEAEDCGTCSAFSRRSRHRKRRRRKRRSRQHIAKHRSLLIDLLLSRHRMLPVVPLATLSVVCRHHRSNSCNLQSRNLASAHQAEIFELTARLRQVESGRARNLAD